MQQKQRVGKSYSIASPYMQLLQSKKKVYGLKYHSSIGNTSHSKSTQNQPNINTNTKGRPASSSMSNNNKSNIKSNSSQKVKSTKSQNTKKKRIYTEQAENYHDISSDPKMHESLFVNMDKEQAASKSLFYNYNNTQQQAKHNAYINNFDFLKKFSEFNANIKQKQLQVLGFSGQKSQKSQKSAKKKKPNNNLYKSNNIHNSMQNTQTANNDPNHNLESIKIGKSVQQLALIQIDELINLIDNCVQQANQYISFLASKVDSLKNQVMKCKAQEFQLQRIIKEKNQQLEQKDLLILRLKKDIDQLKGQKSSGPQDYKSKEMKKILEVMNQMNQKNSHLQLKIKFLQQQAFKIKYTSQNRDYQQEQYMSGSKGVKQKRKTSNGKDIYNQIHSKIDILNISIDNNKKSTNNSYGLNYENEKSDTKKYKFIKPKNK